MIESVGPYRILKRLGSGGMGEVYLAEDERLKRKVALKVLAAHQAEDSESQKRLRREALAVARLDHPNICTVFEVGEWERGTYIAMQAVEGSTLSDLMEKGRFTLSEVLNIALQTADALQEAHDKGILHRDLKPHNLMLTPKGQVKVLDFGLAKPLTKQALGESLTSGVGMTIGTVPYMSPEQVKGEDLDARSDLFSLGLVLYELATGQRAFQAESAVEVMAAILREEPAHMRDEDAALHPAFRSILARLLEKDRDLRIPTARALTQELEQLRAALGENILSRPFGYLPTGRIPVAQRLRRAYRRRPRWVIPGTVGALAGIAVMAWLLLNPGPGLDSIAVLPVINQKGQAETTYLCDGLSQGLVNELARHPKLKVIGLASAAQSVAKDQDLKRIGKELGVEAILQSRLNVEGNHLELDVELVDTRNLRHLWGRHYTGRTVDLWTLQEKLLEDFGETHIPQLAKHRPPRDRKGIGGDAYEFFLKGNAASINITPTANQEALAYYDEALRRAPTFAEAQAAKAQVYFYLSTNHLSPKFALGQAQYHAQAALRIDPQLPEALSLLAYTLAVLDLDYAGADTRYREAIRISPGSVKARTDYGTFLACLGRKEEADMQFQEALRLDPLSADLHTWVSFSYLLRKHPEKAMEHAGMALKLAPQSWMPICFKAWAMGQDGNWRAAERELASLPKELDASYLLMMRGMAASHLGQKDLARTMMKRLLGPPPGQGAPARVQAAYIALALGERSTALDLLESGIEAREEPVLFLKSIPFLEDLHSEERFHKILAMAGQTN